jgi:hypothetical protein
MMERAKFERLIELSTSKSNEAECQQLQSELEQLEKDRHKRDPEVICAEIQAALETACRGALPDGLWQDLCVGVDKDILARSKRTWTVKLKASGTMLFGDDGHVRVRRTPGTTLAFSIGDLATWRTPEGELGVRRIIDDVATALTKHVTENRR